MRTAVGDGVKVGYRLISRPSRLAAGDCCLTPRTLRVRASARRTSGVHRHPFERPRRGAEVFYWVVKAILTPLLTRALPAVDRGPGERPGDRPGDPRQQSPLLPRLDFHAAAGAAAGHVPGQERLLHRAGPQGPAQADVLHRRRSGADRPQRRPRQRGRAARPGSTSSTRASCSASTPRAPARRTAGSTAARSASPGWRSRRECPSSRSR